MNRKSMMTIGYTAGVFDLFHIGHLNLLKNARAMCDRLIVAVSTEQIVAQHKNKRAIIPFAERCEIIRSIQYVDVVIAQEDRDKFEAWKKLRFDILFVGDDWYGNPKWEEYASKFDKVGVRIVYFPYTKGTSSTLVNELLQRERNRF